MSGIAHRSLTSHAIALNHEVLFKSIDKTTNKPLSEVIKEQCEIKVRDLIKDITSSITDVTLPINVTCELPQYYDGR